MYISADTSHPLLAHLFHLHALVLRHLARVLSALGCPRTIPRQTESDMHIVQLSHLILHVRSFHTPITLHFACLFFKHVTPSQRPLLPQRRRRRRILFVFIGYCTGTPWHASLRGVSASGVRASIVCARCCRSQRLRASFSCVGVHVYFQHVALHVYCPL